MIWRGFEMEEKKETNFILEFVKLCKGTEIPELFAVWGGLSAISAALGRRVWMDMGVYTIFPNLYVVLVASSGRFRKSTAIDFAVELLRDEEVKPPVNFVAQSLTPEALIGSLLNGKKVEQIDGKRVATCEGFVVADELSTFLNKKTYDLGIAPLLIHFFDCKRVYVYETKSRGKETLENVWLGMLAGSTVEWIRNAIPADAVGGGLTSRLIFVYADSPPKPVARTSLSDEQKDRRKELSRMLGKMRKLRGPVEMLPETWEEYERSYEKHCTESPFFIMPFLSGYAARWHVHVLTISMLLAVSEFPSATPVKIHRRHFVAAKEILATSEVFMPKILTLITSSEKGAMMELIASHVEQMADGVSRELLLRSVSHRISLRDFDEAVSTLIAAGRIERLSDARGTFYKRKRRGGG